MSIHYLSINLRTIGIDSAKNIFQVYGVNEHMKPQFNKWLKRNELLDFMRQQEPNLVMMEAYYSSHYWERGMAKLGHDTQLVPAQHVTPFVMGNKNDPNDSFAIPEASQRPNICFVPIKTELQQKISCLHRVGDRLSKKNRTE
jgi:transposase